MPRPTLFNHPKFHRLCHVLAMPEPHVLGHLEFLWRVGYDSGNPVIGDELDIEIAAKWSGESGVFSHALLQVGLIDRIEETGKLQIHDLHDNAPDYVKSRFRMERYRKRTSSGELRNGYHSTAPAPAPAPAPVPKPTVLDSTVGSFEPGFGVDAPAKPARARKPRPRDELFDAVALVTHSDPAAAGSHIGRVCKDLRAADPPYSPDEVRRLPEAIAAAGLSFTLTLGSVPKYIGWVRNPPPATTNPSPNGDEQAELLARFEGSDQWHPKSRDEVIKLCQPPEGVAS